MSSCHIRQQWSLPDRSDMSDMSDRLQSQGDLGTSYFILYKDQNITAGLDSLHVSVATWWFAALRISTYISSYLIPVKLIPYFPFRWTKFVFYIERNAACFDHINRVREMSDHPGDVNSVIIVTGPFLAGPNIPLSRNWDQFRPFITGQDPHRGAVCQIFLVFLLHLGNELHYSFITLSFISNTWQHCFERQGVSLLKSIAIICIYTYT